MIEYNLNNSEMTILSLINEKPHHGYELERLITKRGLREWTTIGFSSIYVLLNNLVKRGLATSNLQPAAGRGPAKKVYTATRNGNETLRGAIRRCLAQPDQDSRNFLLGLSCLPLLSNAETVSALSERIAALAERINALSTHPAVTGTFTPPHVTAMFNYSLVQLVSELTWTNQYIASFNKGD